MGLCGAGMDPTPLHTLLSFWPWAAFLKCCVLLLFKAVPEIPMYRCLSSAGIDVKRSPQWQNLRELPRGGDPMTCLSWTSLSRGSSHACSRQLPLPSSHSCQLLPSCIYLKAFSQQEEENWEAQRDSCSPQGWCMTLEALHYLVLSHLLVVGSGRKPFHTCRQGKIRGKILQTSGTKAEHYL